jgi:predicted aldo/keto reductase-like oxidoreductase
MMDNVIKSKFYDVVLSWLNFRSDAKQIAALRRVRKAGVGIIAMKTQAGGYEKAATEGLSPQQAALAWVLKQDFVDSTIPGMVNMEEVVESVGAVGKKVGWSGRKTLHAYYRAISRALMYSEGYKDFDLACLTYRWLSPQQNASACVSCTAPTCRCQNGINIPERMRQAHSLFA